MRGVLIPLVCLALNACSSDDGAGDPESTEGLSYAFSFTTPPGEETHWCEYVRLPKAEAGKTMVTGYRWSWQDLHHWALYRTTPDLPKDVPLGKPFDCFQPDAMKYAPPGALMVAVDQQGHDTFPEAMGFPFESEEIVIFQAHTVNATSAPLTVKLDITLETAAPESMEHELGLLQFYDPYIAVPARSEAKAQMRCAIPHDVTVLRGTTHQHLRGTRVQSFIDPAEGERSSTPFIESTNWDRPTILDAPVQLTGGSHVRTVCDYQGGESATFQGQDKLDAEMCMFIGYYYPIVPAEDNGGLFENCVQTPIPGGVGDEYGTGSATCAETLSCIRSCPPGEAPRPGDGKIDVGGCWQQCIVSSCPAASAPVNAVGYCVQNKCAEACAQGEAACGSCVLGDCGQEYGACQSAACGP